MEGDTKAITTATRATPFRTFMASHRANAMTRTARIGVTTQAVRDPAPTRSQTHSAIPISGATASFLRATQSTMKQTIARLANSPRLFL